MLLVWEWYVTFATYKSQTKIYPHGKENDQAGEAARQISPACEPLERWAGSSLAERERSMAGGGGL